MQLFDKTLNGDPRREVLNLIKNTVIEQLTIPNTTFLDNKESSQGTTSFWDNNQIILPKVIKLRLIHNFMLDHINLPESMLKTFPNIKILDIEQVKLGE